MRGIWLALVFLAGCSGSGDGGDGGGGNEAAAGDAKAKAAPASGGLTTLTGLYEGGQAQSPNQLCIVERESGAQFGLVVWGGNLHSCSGSGTVTRAGNGLRFSMAGDEACAVDAAVDGKTITLPQTVPQGCAYYCGARAQLGGVAFTQRGATEADAGKAKDLVGDRLCTGG